MGIVAEISFYAAILFFAGKAFMNLIHGGGASGTDVTTSRRLNKVKSGAGKVANKVGQIAH